MSIKWDKKVWKSVSSEVRQQIHVETERVFQDIVTMANDTKSGRIYIKHDAGADPAGRRHQASAPGEPWANDTGNALGNTDTRYEGTNETFVRGVVSLDFPYALHLELGTERMSPRPMAVPALENRRQKIINNIRKAVKRGITKAGGDPSSVSVGKG